MDKLFKPWTTLSPAPPKFQSCFLLPRVETGGQNKSNPTAWHVTHTLFNYDIWGSGCQSNFFLEVWIFCPSTAVYFSTLKVICFYAWKISHFLTIPTQHFFRKNIAILFVHFSSQFCFGVLTCLFPMLSIPFWFLSLNFHFYFDKLKCPLIFQCQLFGCEIAKKSVKFMSQLSRFEITSLFQIAYFNSILRFLPSNFKNEFSNVPNSDLHFKCLNLWMSKVF